MLENLFNGFSAFIKSIISFLKIIVRSSFSLKKHKTDQKACIILGNGPSLKTVLKNDKDQLKQHTLFCVNKFPDTDAFEIVKPRYFLITSKEYWNYGKIKKYQEIRENVKKALVEKTTWPLTFFVPQQARSNPDFIKRIQSNPNIELCFFNNTPVEGLQSWSNFFMKKGWGLPRPHNVLIPSIYNCVNAGFKKIYLVGADHSWIPLISVNEDNVALVNQQHFYDEGQTKAESMHRNSRPRRLHEILEKFMLSFRSYFELKAYAESRGTQIYNCTPGSFIDAFERKDIKEVLTP